MTPTTEHLLPWYRQVWFWMVCGPLLFIIVMCIITVSMAFHYSDDVVTDNYYKEGIAINKILQQDVQALALKLTATIRFDRTTHEVLVSIKNEKQLPKILLLFMDHPVKKTKDQYLILREVIKGEYRGEMSTQPDFFWYLALVPVVGMPVTETPGVEASEMESQAAKVSGIETLELAMSRRKQAEWLLTGTIDFSKNTETFLQPRVK